MLLMQPNTFSARPTLVLLAFIYSLSIIAQRTPYRTGGMENKSPQLPPREDTANYAIYPKDTTNKDQAKAINALLQELVTDKSQLYVSDTSRRTLFWAAPLTSGDAQKVASDPNVSFDGVVGRVNGY